MVTFETRTSARPIFFLRRFHPIAEPARARRRDARGQYARSAATAGWRRCTAPPAVLTAGPALRSHPASGAVLLEQSSGPACSLPPERGPAQPGYTAIPGRAVAGPGPYAARQLHRFVRGRTWAVWHFPAEYCRAAHRFPVAWDCRRSGALKEVR